MPGNGMSLEIVEQGFEKVSISSLLEIDGFTNYSDICSKSLYYLNALWPVFIIFLYYTEGLPISFTLMLICTSMGIVTWF